MKMKSVNTLWFLPVMFMLIEGASVLKRAPAAQCPNGSVRHEESCYTFHHELLSWPESITFCKAIDAHLVRIETSSEFHFLNSHALSLQASYTGDGYWIAATDAKEEGTWTWINPIAPMTLNQVTWLPGDPSHHLREDCGVMWKPSSYLVGDYFCNAKLHLICEVEITPDAQIVG